MPVNAAYYLAFDVEPVGLEAMQRLGMSMWLGTDGLDAPEVQEALEARRAVGRTRTANATAFDKDGMWQVNVIRCNDPEAYVESSLDLFRAFQDVDGPVGAMFQNIAIEPNAETYEGVGLTRIAMTFDLKAMNQGPGNKQSLAVMKAIFGGDTLTTWMGSKDDHVVTVTAANWDKAKALLDDLGAGEDTLGQTAGYKSVRSRLPEEVSGLFLVNMQGVVRQYAAIFSAMIEDGELGPPAAMPTEPAFVGVSVTTDPNGLQLDVVVPSNVGPVIEKGLISMFQGLDEQL